MRIINNEIISWERVQHFACNECGKPLIGKWWKPQDENSALYCAECCDKQYTLLIHDADKKLVKVQIEEIEEEIKNA